MGQTMAEKIFTRKNKDKKAVAAGDIVDAKIDGIMAHYGFYMMSEWAAKAGFSEGIPKVFDRERLFILNDHHQPAMSQLQADRSIMIRKHVEQLGPAVYEEQPGIAHQMMVERGYARPGELIVGMDSHTISYGCINAASTGITPIEAVYATMFGELWFEVPESIKVVLEGDLPNYPIAKDIILSLAGKYGDDFGTGSSIEYSGQLAERMSIESRMCIATHGVEVGSTFSMFQYDEKTRNWFAERTTKPYEPLAADADARYKAEIHLNVNDMPFVVAKPHKFGNVCPVDDVSGVQIQQAMIGSCANGRYEDIEVAARALKGRKVAKNVRFIVSPASQAVYLRCMQTGVAQTIVEAGGHLITPGCGICQPKVAFLSAGEVCITSTTRNFRGRKGSTDAEIYLGGPLTVVAAAVAGEIANPREVFREFF